MLNLKYSFEKQKLNKNRDHELILLEIFNEKSQKENKNIERKKLNLCLCIDVSASMGEPLNKKEYLRHSGFPPFGNIHFNHGNKEKYNHKIKLDLAIKAAIKAIDSMSDGDIVSVVEFDNNYETIIKPTELNKNNRFFIKDIIANMKTKGSTNIHDAWLEAVRNVAENINTKYLNRVILLTDGQIVTGERNIDIISSNVRNIADKHISTSTFGVGDDFNEILLKSMSDAGNGNFYYIDDEKTFDSMFEEEFTGASNVIATNVLLSFDGVDVLECFNDVNFKNKSYLLGDLNSISKKSLLFKINTKNKNFDLNKIGCVSLEFINSEGTKVKISFDINVDFVDESTWEGLEDNQEVKVQELLLEIARNKQKATEAFRKGDRATGSTILRGVCSLAESSGYTDSRLSAESNSITATLNKSESMSDSALTKEVHYQSYKTLKG